MQESSFEYFCYSCEKYINTQRQTFFCTFCDSNAIQSTEQCQQMDTPSKFVIYQVANNHTFTQMVGTLDNGIGPRGPQVSRTVLSFMSTTLSDIMEGSYLSNLLGQLLRNGESMTAATQQQIQKLQKICKVKECSICQSNQQENSEQMMQNQVKPSQQSSSQGFKLACNHTFHASCIRPWFQRTNTCPVCRKGIHQ